MASLTWSTATDWDNAVSESNVAHPSDIVQLYPGDDSFEDITLNDPPPDPPYINVNNATITNTRGYDGSYSLTFTRDLGLSLDETGVQPDVFSFVYWETQNISGFGIHLYDSSGNEICVIGSNNPEPHVKGANTDEDGASPGDYNSWRRFTITFDWANNQFDVLWEDVTGDAADQTWSNLDFINVNASDLAEWREDTNSWNGGPPDVEELFFDNSWGVYTTGSIETATKSFATDVQPDLSGLTYSLNGGSMSVDVIGSPGTGSEETVTQTLDGSSSYSLSWSNSHTDFRIKVNFTAADRDSNQTFSAVTLDAPGQTISASAETLTASGPPLSIDAVGVIQASVETLTASEPSIGQIDFTLTASVETLTLTEVSPLIAPGETIRASVETLSASEPSPTFSVTISPSAESLVLIELSPGVVPETDETITPSVETLSIGEPELAFLRDGWAVNGSEQVSIVDMTMTHDELRLTYQVNTANVTEIRAFGDNAGDYRQVVDSDGSWEVIDMSSGNNRFSVSPPISLEPPLDTGKYAVASYSEEGANAGFTRRIQVRFIKYKPRDVIYTTNQSAASDEWQFDFVEGTISTRHVQQVDEDDEDSYTLTLGVDADAAGIIIGSVNRVDAVSVEEIPDGDDFVRDNSSGDRNTVTITRPSDLSSYWLPANGDYVVTSWQLIETPPPFGKESWVFEMNVRKL